MAELRGTADDRPANGPRRILVVIPTLNEARTIEAVIEQLSLGLPFESMARTTFVVVDGGSTDLTVARVEGLMTHHPHLRLMTNPRRIQSAAVNMAVRRHGKDCDVLVRCDAHADYPPGYIHALDDALRLTSASAVVVPMDSVGVTGFQKAVAWASNSWVGTGGSVHRGGRQSGYVDHGHHAAFRMSSFRGAGGYDETYTHNEDAELDCRQRAIGGRIWLDADIRVAYKPRATVASLAKQYFAYGKGRSRTVRKHPMSMKPRQMAVPAHFLLTALCLATVPLTPWMLAWPAFYLAALAAVSVQTAVKHRSAFGLLAGLAAGTMHMAWAAGFLVGMATVREKPWQRENATPFSPTLSAH